MFPRAAGLLLVLSLTGCGDSERRAPDADLRQLLALDREAHLQTSASLLASHLADTLISVDAGIVTQSPRDSVRSMFERYFSGARYHFWEDTEPPVIRVAPRGDMAWVIRKVRVEREEPAEDGARRTRGFVTAYTATYERRYGAWRMTSVTSTFLPPS